MNDTANQSIIVGISGSVALVFAKVLESVLTPLIDERLLLWSTIGLSTVTVYLCTFKISDLFHQKFLWRLFRANLSGSWAASLTNLEDDSTRKSKVSIVQTRDKILVSAVNYRDDQDVPYSNWRSVNCMITDDRLLILYEVESAKDSFHYKRGVMHLELTQLNNDLIHGFYFDSAPSNARGPIEFKRE